MIFTVHLPMKIVETILTRAQFLRHFVLPPFYRIEISYRAEGPGRTDEWRNAHPRPFSDTARGSAAPGIRARMHYALRCAHITVGAGYRLGSDRVARTWTTLFSKRVMRRFGRGEGKDVEATPGRCRRGRADRPNAG